MVTRSSQNIAVTRSLTERCDYNRMFREDLGVWFGLVGKEKKMQQWSLNALRSIVIAYILRINVSIIST